MDTDDKTRHGTASIPERAKRARIYFLDRASSEKQNEWREAFEHMRHLAEAVEETASLMEHVKIQVDEIRHAMGLHLETTGTVPHTKRGPRRGRARPASPRPAPA